MKSEKRTYHPLVMYLYFTGKLDKKFVKQIPQTTIQYWKSLNHKEMFGYEWVAQTVDNIEKQELTTKKKVIRNAVQVCGRILHTFSTIQNPNEVKKQVRKHSVEIVKTIDAIAPVISLKKSTRIFNITEQQYYRWKNKIHCSASVLNLCFKVHPNQLTVEECVKVQSAVLNPKNIGKPLSTIYYGMLRNEIACFSMSTFYKYARLFEPKRVFNKIYFREPNNFRASHAFEYLHIDTTKVFTQQQGWLRTVFVKDNYSKALLYKDIVPGAGSLYIKEVIQNTFKKHALYSIHTPITIISDNGSENKGELSHWLTNKKNKLVHRVIAKIDTDISNNMVESANHQFKNVFLKNRVLPKNKEDLFAYLDEFEEYINGEWTPGEFYGLTPLEVLQGEIPDKYRFTSDIKFSQQHRIYENRMIGLEICKECVNLN